MMKMQETLNRKIKFNISIGSLLLLLFLNTSLLLNVRFSSSLIYILFFVIFITYFINNGITISRADKCVVLLLFLIFGIDKLNDTLTPFDLKQLIPLLFGLFWICFLLNNINRYIIRYLKSYSALSLILLLVWGVVNGIPLNSLDRDSSLLILMWIMLVCYSNSSNIFKLFCVFLFMLSEIFIFESRSIIGAFVLFILMRFLFEKLLRHEKLIITFQRIILLLFVLYSISFSIYGIVYEYIIYHGYSCEFTGRGLIWGQAIGCSIDIFDFTVIDWKGLLFGFSTSPEELFKHFSDSIQIAGDEIEHMEDILLGGHFHNGFVYIFHNAGLFGLISFVILLFVSIKRLKYNCCNFCILLPLLFVFLLNGRSLLGIYTSSCLLIIPLLVPFHYSQPDENLYYT